MAGPTSEAMAQFRASIRRVVEAEVAPHVDAWEADAVPADLLARAGELGWLGLSVPESDSGQGADLWADAILLEEVARVSMSAATTLAIQTDLLALRLAGTEDQRTRWLTPALAGQVTVAVAVTNPPDEVDAQTSANDEAGTAPVGAAPVVAAPVVARREGAGWILTGTKPWVTNGSRADLLIVAAGTAEDAEPGATVGATTDTGDHATAGSDDGATRATQQDRTLFLVDATLPGMRVAEAVDSLGLRGADVASITFDGVAVGADAVLGEVGGADTLLAWERTRHRLLAAVMAVAAAGVETTRATDYARQREAFGRPILRFQAVKHRLVEMATAVEQARAQTYEAIDRWTATDPPAAIDPPEHLAVEVAMANLAATRMAWQVADDAMQTHGGYGYSEEYPVQRAWRDARVGRILHGPDEALRDQVADLVMADPGGWAPPRTLLADHQQVLAAADDFVTRELAPHVPAWEAARDFPRELFQTVGAAGWFGAKFEPRWGGTGPDLLAEVTWLEALARSGSGGVAADLGATSQLAAVYLDKQGTDDQKQRWLVPSITGEAVGGLGVTEPGAGSDVNGLRTRARRDGGDWVIDGAKVFITNGSWADHVVVAARTDPDAGHAGITLFVVERGMPGFTSRRMTMLGWQTSHTGELTFEDVRVPDSHRLGEEGRGFYAIMQNFAWERLTLALGAVVAAEDALRMAVRHATHRRVGGVALADRQSWRHRFADLATAITGARALTDHALALHLTAESGTTSTPGQPPAVQPPAAGADGLAYETQRTRFHDRPPDAEVVGADGLAYETQRTRYDVGATAADRAAVLRLTAMAKLVTQRLAVEAADLNMQVHGAAGTRMDHPAQRYLRDARLGPIGGGTDDIMREIIGGTLGM